MNSFPLFGYSVPPKPPVIKRPLLPPFPDLSDERGNRLVWSQGPGKYLTEITVDLNSPNAYKGNFCGLAGFPLVDAGSPDAFMTMFLDRLPIDEQHRFLERYASYGYNTVQQSIWHSHRQFGRTLDQFISTQALIKSYGLKTDIWFTAEVRDAHIDYWKAELEEWIDELISAKVMDNGGVGWQVDGGNTPRTLQEQIEWFSSKLKPNNILMNCHWMNDALAWWDDPNTPANETIASMGGAQHQGITNRFAWHNLNNQYIDYHHMQVNVWAPINSPTGGIQGAIATCLETCNVVICEYCAQSRFDNLTTEDAGDLMGRLLMASPRGKYKLLGYNNGGRLEDGSVL